MAVYLFFDESGDLNFSPKGSKYYFLGVLTTGEPAALMHPLSRLRYELLAKGIEIRYFHAAEDTQAVRNKVFDLLVEVGGFEFDCVVIEKAKANPVLHDATRFYPQFADYLLRYLFQRYSDESQRLVIITDRIPIKRTRKAVEKAIKSNISRHLGNRPYTLIHDSTAGHTCLQASDYCMWAVQKKWRDGDTRSYNRVSRFIRSEFEIFRKGKEKFY